MLFLFQDYQQKASLFLWLLCKTNTASAGLKERLGQLGQSGMPALGVTCGHSHLLGCAASLRPMEMQQLSALFKAETSFFSCLLPWASQWLHRMSKTYPGSQHPPQKEEAPIMWVYINTRAHTALPPSGLLTTKGGVQTWFRVGFSPLNAINMVYKFNTNTYPALPSQRGGARLGRHQDQAVGVSQLCSCRWKYQFLGIRFR